MPQDTRLDPRPVAEIFEDLRVLAQSKGALHEISGLIFRDLFLMVDRHGGGVLNPPEDRWSLSKLNKNEFLLLLGLMVQSPNESTLASGSGSEGFAKRADSLFLEFHKRLVLDRLETYDLWSDQFTERPDAVGLMGREAIYYAADSFYLHQFVNFSGQRYRKDEEWLQRNVGMSINEMLDVARFIIDRINEQMTSVEHLRARGHHLSKGDLTRSLLIAKEEVQRTFGAKSRAFLAKFVTPITAANAEFSNPFSLNVVALAPIIGMGDYLYVPIQYRLFESICESPFYWMMADKEYEETHAENRGAFLEEAAAGILRSVFRAENVYQNVEIWRNARDRAGEIDVLVTYGEFLLVVQAKSKRVTLKARAGHSESLKDDFEGAIQDPYRQALKCIELIKSGAKCLTDDGKRLEFCASPRLIPMVLLSDSFPASTILSRTMLERNQEIAPLVWDIGVLDCVTRLLPKPIEFLFYLKSRCDGFENIASDSEYNYLGYHIRTKLALPSDTDFLVLERDFATVVDDFMVAADLDIPSKLPVGIWDRLEIPAVSELLTELRNADQRAASVVIDLYDFSANALGDISTNILNLREEIAATGKAIKAFSILTTSGGLTYAVSLRRNSRAALAARAIGAKHKYDNGCDRWYVVLDCLETDNPVDALLALIWPWVEDEQEARASKHVAKMFNSKREEITLGPAGTNT